MKCEHCATEKMFGLGGAFVYVQCAICDSLTLQDPPTLSTFYPETYYSLSSDEWPGLRRKLSAIYRVLDQVCLRIPIRNSVCELMALFAKHRNGMQARILDVGCGNGIFLRRLREIGFSNVSGIDPFLEDDRYSHGIALRKCSIHDLSDGPYDFIVFNHSLEHTEEPHRELTAARDLLCSSGIVAVRIPVPAYAWKRYGVDWVQLDAPRHVVLPTVPGMKALASRAGFEIVKVRFDSSSFQFWGSVRYRSGRTLENCERPVLSIAWLIGHLKRVPYSATARMLNAIGRGDQATFYLRPSA